jgi:hypothetical protein
MNPIAVSIRPANWTTAPMVFVRRSYAICRIARTNLHTTSFASC